MENSIVFETTIEASAEKAKILRVDTHGAGFSGHSHEDRFHL